ncbi:hypothetical protein OAR75_00435 [Candidatus Pelagibacter sp.]|jgi:hypothetical protein|nr:hypothetical protein [Candidatus Pelagibacter sp.]|tara:strand:+ start:86 stop:1075 length:990 start_codon:yes stop_codon:yes gene_type:complete
MLLQKIKIFFFFLIIFNFSKIRYFLKIFKINRNIFDSCYSSLNYNFLGSNHPRRYEAYSRRFRSIKFWFKKNSKWQQKNKDKSLNFCYFNELQKKFNNDVDIIFFGDSHVEYLSRILENEESIKPKNIKSYWVGPKTVIGMLSKESSEDVIGNLKKLLNKTNRKCYIIFSFGSIDIRCSFYEIIFRKISKNENELFKLFERGLRVLISKVIAKAKAKSNIIGVGYLGLFNSSLAGKEPNSLKSLIAIRRKNYYPTLGFKSKRNRWTFKANLLIKKIMKSHKIDIIGEDSLLKIKNLDKMLVDGAHLSSNKIVNQVYIDIFSKVKKNEDK